MRWRSVAGMGCAAAICAWAAGAQMPSGNVRSRGVTVLQPGGAAAPAPTPVAKPTSTPVPKPSPTPQPLPQPVVKDCARPYAKADVTLGGGAGFDARLRPLLVAKRAQVVVDLAQPYPVDGAAPGVLQPWLDQVRSTGGQVRQVPYCTASRGLFGFFRKLFKGDPAHYAAAANYDAALQVNGVDNRVTQVVFTRRAAK